MLNENQLKTKLETTIEAYKNIFGSAPELGAMLQVLEDAIEKRQMEVLTSRLTDQRADKELLGLRDIVSEMTKTTSAPKKAAKKKQVDKEYVPNPEIYAKN